MVGKAFAGITITNNSELQRNGKPIHIGEIESFKR